MLNKVVKRTLEILKKGKIKIKKNHEKTMDNSGLIQYIFSAMVFILSIKRQKKLQKGNHREIAELNNFCNSFTSVYKYIDPFFQFRFPDVMDIILSIYGFTCKE